MWSLQQLSFAIFHEFQRTSLQFYHVFICRYATRQTCGFYHTVWLSCFLTKCDFFISIDIAYVKYAELCIYTLHAYNVLSCNRYTLIYV